MESKKYHIIGVMSGTSLDGIDLAEINFFYTNNNWSFEILCCQTIAYEKQWLDILKEAIHYDSNKLKKVNEEYTSYLGNCINDFITSNGIRDIDVICSHGHTIHHKPDLSYTLQIGNLPEIAAIVRQNVVCDFRIQDVFLGGQGAPLVPIGDKLLFSKYDYCLNLGGFSNVSFDHQNNRIAFDISPVNTVLNFYSQKLGFDFDDKGDLSRKGNFSEKLFATLNTIDFYKQACPKSLGLEFVKETIFPIIDSFNLSEYDILRTFTEHIAFQISNVLNNKNTSLLITGGGAYNDFLIERIRYYLPTTTVEIPSKEILEFKEALIFGLLGILKLRGDINVLSSVTGSKHDHSSGQIYKY